MEYVMNCDVCSSSAFDENSVIPKVLDCGHSFCLSCIEKLVDSNPYCPKCRADISEEEYPTNFSLLNASEAYQSFKYLESHMVCSIQTMKSKLEAKKEILTKKRSEISTNLEVIKQGLKRLQELTDPDSEEMDYKKAKMVLENLENDYKRIENVHLFNFWKLRISVNINISCFETPDGYLLEIYNRLTKEENIYAVENIENVVKYGKVTLQNNMILFHALSRMEKPENSTLIWFNELKQCITDNNFCTFLKFSCNENGVIHMVTIEMRDTQLTPQFVKLCTGECGPTYKNCQYVKGEEVPSQYFNVAKLEKYLLNDTPKIGRIDYCIMGECREHNFNTNDLILMGETDGSFSLVRLITTRLTRGNIIGKVISPPNLDEFITYNDPSKLKIVDCGIFFKI